MKKRHSYSIFALIGLGILLMLMPETYARYAISFPFAIDSGGKPVSSATVGINVSTSKNCQDTFYRNITTAQYGRGQINVTSSLFVESKNYYFCYNATSGSNTIFGGPILFQVGVGRHNETEGLLKNNTQQGKIYLNTTNGLWANEFAFWNNRLCTDNTCNTGIENDTSGNLQLIRGGALYASVQTAAWQLNTNVRPSANNILRIGNSSRRWAVGYFSKYIIVPNVNVTSITLNNNTITSWPATGIANNTAQGKIYLNASNGIYLPWKTMIGNGTLGYLNITPVIIKLNQNAQLWVLNDLLVRGGAGLDGTGRISVASIIGNNGLLLTTNVDADATINPYAGAIMLNSTRGVIVNKTLQVGDNKVIVNNTKNGKAYINGSLYPKEIMFGTWNITANASTLSIWANSSRAIQTTNNEKPYSSSGCFRINGVTGLGASNTILPGTIHLGTECGQGWAGSYIDINDIHQNTSNQARLMQFFWTNEYDPSLPGHSGGYGIGLSMKLVSKAISTTPMDINLDYEGADGNANNVVRMIKLNMLGFGVTDNEAVGDLRFIDIGNNLIDSGMPLIRETGFSMTGPSTVNKIKGLAGIELRRALIGYRALTAGLVMNRQALAAGVSAGKHNRTYAVLSDTGIIQVSEGTPIFYNGPEWNSANWQEVTIGNVSTAYYYPKDFIYIQFAGRNSDKINITKADERYYNISVAKQVVINTTLSIGKNITMKSNNSVTYNCGLRQLNNGSFWFACNGTKMWSG